MRLRDDRRRVGAVAVGQLLAHALDHLERLGVASLRGQDADQQRDQRLVGRRAQSAAAQVVDHVRGVADRQPALRAQRDDLAEQAGRRGVRQVGDGRDERACFGAQQVRGRRVACAHRGSGALQQVLGLGGVDLEVVGGQPVAAGRPGDGQPEPARPGDQRLHRTAGVVGRDALPDVLDEGGRRDDPPARVEQRADQRDQLVPADGLAVDGQRPEGGDLHVHSIPHLPAS